MRVDLNLPFEVDQVLYHRANTARFRANSMTDWGALKGWEGYDDWEQEVNRGYQTIQLLEDFINSASDDVRERLRW